MDDTKLNEQVDELEAYYWDEEQDKSKLEDKNFERKCKALEMMLKVQNQQKQIELESKRLEFEIEQAKSQNKLEEQKLEVSKEANKIEADKAENEKKASKKDFWLNIAKAGAGLLGVAASTAFGVWATTTTMKFEETGCVRSSAGKLAQGLASKTITKLENAKKDI